ncbi:endonuclease/exonuclease/phosphatase family protein [Actinoplanes sp. NPDC048791]|uniref:endonuclease/exonuclease/phosphatase family protein n=1 Tax=Actinoplanes sp. NPDC048791 TaxID=3154623 RepID=UPI0033F41F48
MVTNLRIATLNTWGTRGDWKARRPILQRGFEALSPDLITLQETIVTDGYDQAREILSLAYHLIHQSAREPDGQGVTTASRWPIGQALEVDLHLTPRTASFASTCLITEILVPEPLGRIWLANHLPDWQLDHEHERQLQATAAARALARLNADRPGHLIVAGDLDADPGHQRSVLDGPPRPRRAQRLLPRRLGECPPRRARAHLRPRESVRRRLGLAFPADRLHPRRLR